MKFSLRSDTAKMPKKEEFSFKGKLRVIGRSQGCQFSFLFLPKLRTHTRIPL